MPICLKIKPAHHGIFKLFLTIVSGDTAIQNLKTRWVKWVLDIALLKQLVHWFLYDLHTFYINFVG